MDNLDRLRKVLDFEGTLRHDPGDRFEAYYGTVLRRLARPDLVIDDPLPSAATLPEPLPEPEPWAPLDLEPAAALVPDDAAPAEAFAEPLAASEPPVDASPEPATETLVADIAPTPGAGFEDEVEFLPFRNGVRPPAELLEFEELWVEPGLAPAAAFMPESNGSELLSTAPLVEPAAHVIPDATAEEVVVAEPELAPAAEPLVIEGYTLYAKRATLRGGERTIHFFAREPTAGAVPAALPEGFEVQRNPRSRLPYLRRIRPAKAGARGRKGAQSAQKSKKRSKRNP